MVYMMIVPRKKDYDLWDDFFRDPFFTVKDSKLMKADIKEHDSGYNILIDLPGYDKSEIKVDVEDGYLTVKASKNEENEEKKEDGKFIRRERIYGECSRSFYVGSGVEAEDIKASYKNGTLSLDVPKKELPEVDNKKYIEISD